jgi:hypothetical protein
MGLILGRHARMSAHVEITETTDGWYVVITDSVNTLVRTEGPRITVACTPDQDATPLDVSLGPPVSPEATS